MKRYLNNRAAVLGGLAGAGGLVLLCIVIVEPRNSWHEIYLMLYAGLALYVSYRTLRLHTRSKGAPPCTSNKPR